MVKSFNCRMCNRSCLMLEDSRPGEHVVLHHMRSLATLFLHACVHLDFLADNLTIHKSDQPHDEVVTRCTSTDAPCADDIRATCLPSVPKEMGSSA